MKMKRFKLECKRSWCSWEQEQKAHVVPIEAWHEHEKLGKKEQHLVNVILLEVDDE